MLSRGENECCGPQACAKSVRRAPERTGEQRESCLPLRSRPRSSCHGRLSRTLGARVRGPRACEGFLPLRSSPRAFFRQTMAFPGTRRPARRDPCPSSSRPATPRACSPSQEDARAALQPEWEMASVSSGQVFHHHLPPQEREKSLLSAAPPNIPNIPPPPRSHLPLLILVLSGRCPPPPSRAAPSHRVLLPRPVPGCSHPTVLSTATLAAARISFPLGTLSAAIPIVGTADNPAGRPYPTA